MYALLIYGKSFQDSMVISAAEEGFDQTAPLPEDLVDWAKTLIVLAKQSNDLVSEVPDPWINGAKQRSGIECDHEKMVANLVKVVGLHTCFKTVHTVFWKKIRRLLPKNATRVEICWDAVDRLSLGWYE